MPLIVGIVLVLVLVLEATVLETSLYVRAYEMSITVFDRWLIICSIAIAQHVTDYKITRVCVSICLSVTSPTVANHRSLEPKKVRSSSLGVKIRPLPRTFPISPFLPSYCIVMQWQNVLAPQIRALWTDCGVW